MSISGADATETAQQNGSPTVDGYGSASPAQPAEHPEVLLGAALVGGLLLAGLVSRIGR